MKKRDIKLYNNAIISLFTIISNIQDIELAIIVVICIFLAFIYLSMETLKGYKSKAAIQREKIDNELREWDRFKKIQTMYEEKALLQNNSECRNVDVKNLI